MNYYGVLHVSGDGNTSMNKKWDYDYNFHYIDGKLHREDGPAIEGIDGYKAYYINDKLHREDGPAVEQADGTKAWYIHGKLHREDGAAIEWGNGSKVYYKNGEQIKVELTDDIGEYWVDGRKIKKV